MDTLVSTASLNNNNAIGLFSFLETFFFFFLKNSVNRLVLVVEKQSKAQ